MGERKPVTLSRLNRVGSSRRLINLLLLTLLLGVAWITGHHFAHYIPQLEEWVSTHGGVGPAVFIGAAVVFTSIFVPDTVFAVIAGVLFGTFGGTLVMIAVSLCTAAVNFALSRLFLQKAVDKALLRHPTLTALQQTVSREGFRFQFLLRLTPINPVVVNYVLGASGTRFLTFLAACAGMIPTLAVEVYFGHAARHVATTAGGISKHSPTHTILTLIGLALCVAVLIYVTQTARKALASYEAAPSDPDKKIGLHSETPE